MYFLNLVISLFFIINLSNFIKYYIKIETKKIFLITILFQIIIGYILSFILTIDFIFFTFLLLNIFCLIKNLKYKFILEINPLMYFVFTYFVFAQITFNRYYLDYDEFTYWGQVLKYFGKSLDYEILLDKTTFWHGTFSDITSAVYKKNPFYHPVGVPIYISINSYIAGYTEYASIFYNNLIVLTGFFYLFFQKEEKYYNFLKFFIFYLLINNLSFGLISIYVDPIISVIFGCILMEIFKNNKNNSHLIIVILTLSLLALHRSGIVYAFYSLLLILFFNNKNFFSKYSLIIFLFILLGIFSSYSVLANLNYNYFVFNSVDLFDYIINAFSVPIYFSSFGATLNTIFELTNYNFKIDLFQISIFFWFIIISFFILFSKKNKFIFLSFLVLTFFHLIILFFEKINLPNMSLLVIGRYMSLLFLSYFLFLSSKLSTNLKIYSLFIILLIAITPSKTFGLFVTNKVYLSSDKNQKFYLNRMLIKKKFKDELNKNKKIIVIDNGQLSKGMSRENRDYYFDIIKYEVYPKKLTFLNDVNDNTLKKYINFENVYFVSLNLNKVSSEKFDKMFLRYNLKYQNILLN